jgi:nickel transport protein
MMLRFAVILALAFALASPALAHSLRVFVTAEGQTVRGYGFFVGGGRPDGAAWRAEADGVTLASGTTTAEGAFGFVLPGPVAGDITVTIDPGDGHAASATLAAARLADPPAVASGTSTRRDPPAPADADAIAAAVEAAVARQVAPLLVRLEEMDARLRLADLVSGGLAIFGLAGIGLWLRGRGR